MVKLYTGKGDLGLTATIGGARTSKSSAQMCTVGTLDELNSLIGVYRSSEPASCLLDQIAFRIQNLLFHLGAHFAVAEGRSSKELTYLRQFTDDEVAGIEKEIDELVLKLPEKKSFVLPGGTQQASLLHLARAVCRRAEREAWSLEEKPDGILLTIINRLSDLLFAMAQFENVLGECLPDSWDSQSITFSPE